MVFKKQFYLACAFATMFAAVSCSDDDTTTSGSEGTTATSQYIIAADDTENSYLVGTDAITEGSVSALGGNGLQVIGTPRWYFYKELAAFSFIYNQSDPGATQSFILDTEGALEARSELNLTVSIQSKGIFNNKMYIEYSSRNYESPVATFYTVDGETEAIEGPITIDTEALAGNGEYAYITDVEQRNNELLIGFRTIKAYSDGGDNAFASDYNDHTYVAVYNEDLELQQVIEDEGRTGPVAGQLKSQGESGIEVVENGDTYVFSSAIDDADVASGVLKINDGEYAFDEDYFFDISAASDGYKLYRTYYVGDNTFVVQMFTDAASASASPSYTRNKFAVVNVVNQTFDWVTGVPEDISSVGIPYIDADSDEVVFPINTSSNPHLYIVDAATATMTEGIEVVAENISAVGKLNAEE